MLNLVGRSVHGQLNLSASFLWNSVASPMATHCRVSKVNVHTPIYKELKSRKQLETVTVHIDGCGSQNVKQTTKALHNYST